MADKSLGDRSPSDMRLLSELRSIAESGLLLGDDEDRERFDRILHITAMLAVGSSGPAREDIESEGGLQWFHVSPIISADSVVFDEQNRLLLIQRADNLQWALPGGLVEVGETPSEAAARETLEECGAVVRPQELMACYDSRFLQTDTAYQVLHMVYLSDLVDGTSLTTSDEVVNFGWFGSWAKLEISPGHVPRIKDAFRWKRGKLKKQPFC